MKVTIAGREVKEGDNLYHTGFRSFGVVTRVQNRNVEVQFHNKLGRSFKLYIEQDGIIGREKLVYWHKPLDLDVPLEDVTGVQAVVDAVVGVMK